MSDELQSMIIDSFSQSSRKYSRQITMNKSTGFVTSFDTNTSRHFATNDSNPNASNLLKHCLKHANVVKLLRDLCFDKKKDPVRFAYRIVRLVPAMDLQPPWFRQGKMMSLAGWPSWALYGGMQCKGLYDGALAYRSRSKS